MHAALACQRAEQALQSECLEWTGLLDGPALRRPLVLDLDMARYREKIAFQFLQCGTVSCRCWRRWRLAGWHTPMWRPLCTQSLFTTFAWPTVASLQLGVCSPPTCQDGPVTRWRIGAKVFRSAAGAGSRAAGARAECGLPVELMAWLEGRQSIVEEWILLTDVGYSFM